jgi:hypothetical protein
VAEENFEITGLPEAYDALESYDPALTKRALRLIVDQGEVAALPRILPLTQHPSPAIRFVAKRAAAELRALPPEQHRKASLPSPEPVVSLPAPPTSSGEDTASLPRAVGALDLDTTSMDPRLQSLLDRPARRRARASAPGGVPMRWFDMEL